MALVTKEEIVLGFYEEGELVAFAKKNGVIEWFKVERMNYGKLVELFKVDTLKPYEKGKDTV